MSSTLTIANILQDFLIPEKVIYVNRPSMDEKANDSSIPSSPPPMLEGRVQLWHWSNDDEGWSVEFNSQLAYQVEAHVLPDWEVRLVDTPGTQYRPGQTFVAIEADFVHKTITHGNATAQNEWDRLWLKILEFTPEFFKHIGGEAIIVRMMSPNLVQQRQGLFVTVETFGPLKLREKVVPTRRSQPGWLTRWKTRLFLTLSFTSYAGLLPWKYTMAAPFVVETVSHIVDRIQETVRPLTQVSDDPLERVAQMLETYRDRYAAWTHCMSEIQQTKCPDIGIRRVEACLKLLTAFGELQNATVTHLAENIEPSYNRSFIYDTLLKAGGTCAVVGLLGWGFAAYAGWTTIACCAGGTGALGLGAALVGLWDPNNGTRDHINKVRGLFDSLKDALHTLYLRTWICFYQEELGIPLHRMSDEEITQLLKGCGVNLSFIQNADYREGVVGLGERKVQDFNEKTMDELHSLFRNIGQELIIQDVAEGH